METLGLTRTIREAADPHGCKLSEVQKHLLRDIFGDPEGGVSYEDPGAMSWAKALLDAWLMGKHGLGYVMSELENAIALGSDKVSLPVGDGLRRILGPHSVPLDPEWCEKYGAEIDRIRDMSGAKAAVMMWRWLAEL